MEVLEQPGDSGYTQRFSRNPDPTNGLHTLRPQSHNRQHPFDFTNKVNVEPQYGQANRCFAAPGETDIPADPLANPIQLRFKNAYTKVVLRITKKEDKNDNQNIGKVTETAIDNLTAEWIKNRGGIDPATGYVKPTSEPGKIWERLDRPWLTTIEPVEFTFLVPAFMDKV